MSPSNGAVNGHLIGVGEFFVFLRPRSRDVGTFGIACA
jgi:hypothetical protein